MLPLFPCFETARVLVAGDVMLDRYWYGDTEHISPEAPVPVVKVSRVEARAGGAANVALNVAALGAEVTLLGIVGDDEAGAELTDTLSADGINNALQVRSEAATICKTRVIGRHQQLLRMDIEAVRQSETSLRILQARFEQLVASHHMVILSDYAKGTLAYSAALIECARAGGVPVIVDPKGGSFERYRGATGMTPNLSELRAVTPASLQGRSIDVQGAHVRDALDLDWLLVTQGEEGMTLYRRNEKRSLHEKALAREVFDVTGAGDTVIATLGTALAAGLPVAQSVAWANRAAGIVVSKLGTSTVSRDELKQSLTLSYAPSAYLYSGAVQDIPALLALVREARAGGETIVMTNGCFDILHAGHVACLEQARGLGTRLLVAVNADESVRRLKGAGRPINPLPQRMAVLAALRVVDWVVAFTDGTPASLIEAISPDVLVKGADYSPEDIAGAEHVLALGGRVEIVDSMSNCSTSGLIATIQKLSASS
ncbi:MAG: bifunctional D-glycero-beta-D-manno-heptose-7-phosphate kinase/D-glycero-beta-D-manno-heptose 1-phosphate adenylyltransferase HldE [Gammaproteobacteria bacterium]|nr:bifunctional D-glycero-beta-D-manno-heptose-7-phosphate kinase/D-glycero-beta-D-manno-heptose 1-phosphate adenylyltransferase HldE [Gammaproteobacteria bacterium]